MWKRLSVFFLVLSVFVVGGAGAQEEEVSVEGAEEYTYKQASETALKAFVFVPPDHRPSDSRPAIGFFFGGGWKKGKPEQFEQHCRYLAARGMVAITFDYRVATRQQVKAVECVSDAKSAIRWMRTQAEKLGIDPERIVAGGGSAGGHLAAATALIAEYDEQEEDAKISSIPNALALFNPALILAPIEGYEAFTEERKAELKERMGVEIEKLSPIHQLPKETGPCIIFHGEADTTVPFQSAKIFTETMVKAGNRCQLVGYPDEGHGFFNVGRNDNKAFVSTVNKLDKFLVELGYLSDAVSDEARMILNETQQKH